MKHFIIISKLFICLVAVFLFQSCKENENDNMDSSALTLLSYTPEQGGNISTEGTIELTFSKAVRQAPDTEITINGKAIRVIITDNVVRAKYSEPLADHITLDIPSGALTDMNSVQKYEGLNLRYEIKLEKRLFDAVVDKNGKGDYTKIQDAIDNAPNNSDVPYLIFVADGVYDEYLNISASKTFIHLIGQSRENTKVQYLMNRVKWDGTGEQPVAWPYSSQNPAYQAQTGLTSSQESIVLVKGADFHAENISFINLYGARADEYGGMGGDGQADAMMTRADRVSFYNCAMVSYQDTWWIRMNNKPEEINARNYADNCWIEGKTDYVYGNANLLVENSTFYNVGLSGNVMTAGSHYDGTTWGHIMKDCTVDGLASANGTTYFARPWQNKPISVWINTTCKVNLDPAGYMDMSVLPYIYGEYNTVDANGTPVDTSNRKTSFSVNGVSTPYDKNMVFTESEIADYTYENIIMGTDGWNPKSFYTTEELPAVENVSIYGTTLSWDGQNKAICYLVFEDDEFIGQTTETTMEVDANGGDYTVKAVNKYGSLSD